MAPWHRASVCGPVGAAVRREGAGAQEAFAYVLKINANRRADMSGEVKATSNYDIEPVYDTNKANKKATLSIGVR